MRKLDDMIREDEKTRRSDATNHKLGAQGNISSNLMLKIISLTSYWGSSAGGPRFHSDAPGILTETFNSVAPGIFSGMSSEAGAHEQQCIRTWSLQIADCAPCSPVGVGAPEILSGIISDWLLAGISCAWPAGARSNVSSRPGCIELRKFARNCAHNIFTGLQARDGDREPREVH